MLLCDFTAKHLTLHHNTGKENSSVSRNVTKVAQRKQSGCFGASCRLHHICHIIILPIITLILIKIHLLLPEALQQMCTCKCKTALLGDAARTGLVAPEYGNGRLIFKCFDGSISGAI